MSGLTDISTEELLFDRQEAFNDLASCAIALAIGQRDYRGKSVMDRAKDDMAQIEVIRGECQRRGFDPAIWPGGAG